MRNGDTVTVLVWLSGPSCYLPQFLVVVYPGELPTFVFACYWLVLLFFVRFLELAFLACLV